MNDKDLYQGAMDYLVVLLIDRYGVGQCLTIQLEMDNDPTDYLFDRFTESLAKLSPESFTSSGRS